MLVDLKVTVDDSISNLLASSSPFMAFVSQNEATPTGSQALNRFQKTMLGLKRQAADAPDKQQAAGPLTECPQDLLFPIPAALASTAAWA